MSTVLAPEADAPKALLAGMRPNTAYTAAGLARMIGRTRRTVDQALRRMASRGRLGLLRVGGGCVYFTSQADADAYGARDAAALAEQIRLKRAENLAATNRRLKANSVGKRGKLPTARPSVPAPVVIAEPAKDDRPADMSRAEWTIAPTPVCRFAVDPASIEPGAFLLDMPAGRWSDYAARRIA